WVAQRRAAEYVDDFQRNVPWGLAIWIRVGSRNNGQALWRGATVPTLRWPPGVPDLDVAFGDVTEDGHPDLLLAQYPGTNHACGPRQVIAAVPGDQQWRVFGATGMCESWITAAHGLLKVAEPIYRKGSGVCCPSKTKL